MRHFASAFDGGRAAREAARVVEADQILNRHIGSMASLDVIRAEQSIYSRRTIHNILAMSIRQSTV